MFRKKATQSDKPEYELFKRIVVKDIPIFSKVCMQYYFENKKDGTKDSLIFVKADRIIKMNFENDQIDTLYEFKTPLNRQPEFF